MAKLYEDLEAHDYVIHQALADMIDLSEEDAKELTNEMDLGDYISLTQALDTEDVDEVREIVSKYMEEMPGLDAQDNDDETSNSGDSGEDDELDVDFDMKEAKEKSAPKPRDPNAVSAKQRKAGAMDEPWSRKKQGKDKMGSKGHRGKLKPKDLGETKKMTETFDRGEQVLYNRQRATVRYPRGPRGTVGIMVNENLHMVKPNEIRKLKEGVLGMSNMPALKRMSQLAGIKEDEYSALEPVTALPEPAAYDDVDPYADAYSDDYGADALGDEMGVEPLGDMGMDYADDMGADYSPANAVDVVSDTGMAPDTGEGDSSPAFSSITQALDTVRNEIGDVRLDEYKPLIQRLQDLQDQVRAMGRDYLGERRKK